MQSASNSGLGERAITKGVHNVTELIIYSDRSMFEIHMARINTPSDLFLGAVALMENFSTAEGVKDTISKYDRTTINSATHIRFEGWYGEPMTPKAIEELYDRLCEKLGK
jgi:hypothetical protein